MLEGEKVVDDDLDDDLLCVMPFDKLITLASILFIVYSIVYSVPALAYTIYCCTIPAEP